MKLKTFENFHSGTVNESMTEMKEYVEDVYRGMGWVTDHKVEEDYYGESPYAIFGLLIVLAKLGYLYDHMKLEDPMSDEPNPSAAMSVQDVIDDNQHLF